MERPLSPFMFPAWYRFQITSVLSILHRLTGIALVVGSILLFPWLPAARCSPLRTLYCLGSLLLFGWSVVR